MPNGPADSFAEHHNGKMPSADPASPAFAAAGPATLSPDAISHAYSARFPTGHNPSDGADETLVPLGGVLAAAEGAPGTPGVWLPYGAPAPSGAPTQTSTTGAVAWATGEYIENAEGDSYYWDGSAWQTGVAP